MDAVRLGMWPYSVSERDAMKERLDLMISARLARDYAEPEVDLRLRGHLHRARQLSRAHPAGGGAEGAGTAPSVASFWTLPISVSESPARRK